MQINKLKYILLVILMTNCASFGDTLDTVRIANKTLVNSALDIIHARCKKIIDSCPNKTDCEEYKKCDEKRQIIVKISKAINHALAIAATAATIGDKDKAIEKLDYAIKLLTQLKNMVEDLQK